MKALVLATVAGGLAIAAINLGGGLLQSRPAAAAGIDRIAVTSPLVGKPAPDFVLTDISGTRVRLENLRGEQNRPVVLFMSAGGGCGTCLAQIEKMAKSAVLTDGSVMAAAVVSSHTDSIDEWRAFVRDHPEFRKIPILFDMSGDALRSYGATALQSGMNHGGGHSAGHSYYVIDRSGVVRLVADDPTMGDWTSALEEFVKSL
jgi:peroxiredoxin